MEVIEQIAEEPGYFSKRSGLYVAGKLVTHQVVHSGIPELLASSSLGEAAIGFLTPEVATPLGLVLGNAAGLVTIGLVAGLSAGLTQMDYNHKILQLKDSVYADELSTKLKKPIHALTSEDLHNAAKENKTIDEQIRKTKRQRNFGVFFSFAASMTAVALVKIAMVQVPMLAAFAAAHPATLFSLDGFPTAAMQGVMGWVSYHVIKAPLHWLGDKLFGLDTETTHDRIMGLQRDREAGKIISREQVLSVFAKANPELNDFIGVNYGARFDKLDLAGKQMATGELSKFIALNQLTDDINSGKINAAELAFAVEGKISGVEHKEGAPRRHTPKGLWTKIRQALQFNAHPKVEVGAIAAQMLEANIAVAYAEEKPKKSFVERLGRSKLDPAVGHVARLEQPAQNAPSSQTIQ